MLWANEPRPMVLAAQAVLLLRARRSGRSQPFSRSTWPAR